MAGEGAGDAGADKAGAMPSYSAGVGQLQRAEEDAARQGTNLAGLNPQQVCTALFSPLKEPYLLFCKEEIPSG